MRARLHVLTALALAAGAGACARTGAGGALPATAAATATTTGPATPRTAPLGPPAAVTSGSPDFSAIALMTADGRPTTLAGAIGARPALVSFWAPWCEPCLREQPDLQRLARAIAPCDALVVGVAVGEGPATVSAFARERQVTFPELADERFALSDALGQRRIPTTLVLDANQHIVFTGEALDQPAITALTSLLHRPSSPCPAP